MQRNNDSKKRKSGFNPNRASYLTLDREFYVYEIWDEDNKRNIVLKLKVGEDLSTGLSIFLDESDHDMDLNDRYEQELRASLFDTKAATHDSETADDGVADPWNTLADKRGGPEDILFAEPEPGNQQAAVVRRVIDEDCTEAQKDFFFEHFGNKTQLEEMRQAEAAQTGKLPSPAAMNNRKNKILDKVAKALGVERVKRRKPKQ